MSGPKLPQPTERMLDISTEDGTQVVTPAWYQYFNAQDHGWRTRVDIVTTNSSGVVKNNILRNRVTVLSGTGNSIYPLEEPAIGMETTIIFSRTTTTNGPNIAKASTAIAIGPGGENALSFPSSVSTYDYVRLIGTSTSQYHILFRTTGVSVVASS